MENLLYCPQCHAEVHEGNYFCANCGKNLKSTPPSTSLEKQILLYLGSVLLPPFGIFWGLKYLRQPDKKSKTVGKISIVLTIVSLVFAFKLTVDLIKTVNNVSSQYEQELQQLGY